jgi:sugar lactone lactonase YvrE
MTKVNRAVTVLALTLGLLPACEDDTVPVIPGPPTYKPQILIELPDQCNTPDGMRMIPGTQDIILSCPNFADTTFPGALYKITADNRLELFTTLPGHPDTNKVGPMGLDFGPDGHLYVADHQYRWDTDFKSRLLRVRISNGQAVGVDVVATGFKLANAVMWNKNSVYVSDTYFDMMDQPGVSGVFRFSRTEMDAATGPIALKAPMTDPHMVTSFRTVAGRGISMAGADGITFDKDGNLYTGNFGDGVLSKLTLDMEGNMSKQETFLVSPKLKCIDGLFYDGGKIYIADAKENAIKTVSMDGVVTQLWANGDTTGKFGELDQPAEVIVRGDELIIANFDAPPGTGGTVNKASDAPHTISVIKLK